MKWVVRPLSTYALQEHPLASEQTTGAYSEEHSGKGLKNTSKNPQERKKFRVESPGGA